MAFTLSLTSREAAGVFFQTVPIEFEVGERKFLAAVFLPVRWVYGVNTKELNLERPFEIRTVTKKRKAKKAAPVVFLDYSGIVMEQLKAAGTTHRYLKASSLADTHLAEAEEPPAAILFNVPLDFLVGMKKCTYIEVHPKEETENAE